MAEMVEKFESIPYNVKTMKNNSNGVNEKW